MMNDPRTDTHRETEFNPENYVEVNYFDRNTRPTLTVFDMFGRPTAERCVNPEYLNLRECLELLAASKSAPYGNGAKCDHCGAAIRYGVLMLHVPTGDHIAVGQTCADGRFTFTQAKFDRLRKMSAEERAQENRLNAFNAFKNTFTEIDWDYAETSDNSFTSDVTRKAYEYGTLSENQVAALVKAIDRDKTFAAERAAREAAEELIDREDAPEGRVTVRGVVLSTKWVDSDFGSTEKMLVQDERGFKVWGTVPSSIEVTRDDVVEFVATLTRSNDDAKFAFAKRPSKAVVIATVGA